MPELPPWAWEALGRGSTAAALLLLIAVVWLARKLDEMNKARAAADQARIADLQAMQPLLREMTAALEANKTIVANANANTVAALDRFNERLISYVGPFIGGRGS